MLVARDTTLCADPPVEECIKWQSSTFTFNDNIVGFIPRSNPHVSLLFHTGAHIPAPTPGFRAALGLCPRAVRWAWQTFGANREIRKR
jgi:hypothetical protein